MPSNSFCSFQLNRLFFAGPAAAVVVGTAAGVACAFALDDAVATAEKGTQVDGVHPPSGDEKSGESRIEHMGDEPVTEPRVEGTPGTAEHPPKAGPGPDDIGSGGAQRIVGARISDRIAAGEDVPDGPPFDESDD